MPPYTPTAGTVRIRVQMIDGGGPMARGVQLPPYPWNVGNNSVSGQAGGGGNAQNQTSPGGVIMPSGWPNVFTASQSGTGASINNIGDLTPSVPASRPTEPGTLFAALDKMKNGKVILTGDHHLEFEEGTASSLFYGQLVRMSKEAEMLYKVDPTIRLSYRYFRELRMPLIVSAGESEKEQER